MNGCECFPCSYRDTRFPNMMQTRSKVSKTNHWYLQFFIFKRFLLLPPIVKLGKVFKPVPRIMPISHLFFFFIFWAFVIKENRISEKYLQQHLSKHILYPIN